MSLAYDRNTYDRWPVCFSLELVPIMLSRLISTRQRHGLFDSGICHFAFVSQHPLFTSPEGGMGIIGEVIQSSTCFVAICIVNFPLVMPAGSTFRDHFFDSLDQKLAFLSIMVTFILILAGLFGQFF